jgi:thiol-disulfide isomerase/thioredoxin
LAPWLAPLLTGIALAATASFAAAVELHSLPLTAYPRQEQTALNAFAGQVLLVNFWAPWCVPCREEFPELDALQKKYAGRGLVILGVTAEENAVKIGKFLERIPVSFAILQDRRAALHEAAKVGAMPSTILLDRQGRVMKVYAGYSREKGLAEMERDVAAQIASTL